MCGSIRVELSQVEFLDLSQANHFEHICDELFSSIKNESYGIEDPIRHAFRASEV